MIMLMVDLVLFSFFLILLKDVFGCIFFCDVDEVCIMCIGKIFLWVVMVGFVGVVFVL